MLQPNTLDLVWPLISPKMKKPFSWKFELERNKMKSGKVDRKTCQVLHTKKPHLNFLKFTLTIVKHFEFEEVFFSSSGCFKHSVRIKLIV